MFKKILLGIGIIFIAVLAFGNLSTKTTKLNIEKVVTPPDQTTSTTFTNNIQKPNIKTLNIDIDRVVFIFGEITDEASIVVSNIKQMIKNGKPFTILINSPGGYVSVGSDIISAMEASPVKIDTVCNGMCASMAALIHQFGDNRYMVDRSVLMFHPAAGGLQGTLEQMDNRLNLIKSLVNEMTGFIAQRNNLTLEQFQREYSNELWMTSREALQRKFIENIVSVYAVSGKSTEISKNFFNNTNKFLKDFFVESPKKTKVQE